jgi:deoxyadenosine/deoxycytidine kinase
MLRLKNTVNKNMKHSIFVHKSRGRKIVFDPQTVDPSEYEYYKSIGFNLFEEDDTITETPAETIIMDEVVEDIIEENIVENTEDIEEFDADELFPINVDEVKEIPSDIITPNVEEEEITPTPKKKKGRPKKS